VGPSFADLPGAMARFSCRPRPEPARYPPSFPALSISLGPPRAFTPAVDRPPPDPAPRTGAKGLFMAGELAAALAAEICWNFPHRTCRPLAGRASRAGQLWRLKGQASRKAMILMGRSRQPACGPGAGCAAAVAGEWRPRCWPGPITAGAAGRGVVVAGCSPIAPAPWREPGPAHSPSDPPWSLLACKRSVGDATSANRSGAPPCRTAGEAAAVFRTSPPFAPLPWPSMAWLGQHRVALEAMIHWRVLRAVLVDARGVPVRSASSRSGTADASVSLAIVVIFPKSFFPWR